MKTLGQLRTWIEETYLCENIIFMYVSGIFEFLMVGNCAKFDINGSAYYVDFKTFATVSHNTSVFSLWFCSVYKIEVHVY